MSYKTHYIKDEWTLKKLCNEIHDDYIAIDTEFISNNYYYPKLGIIQISSGEVHAIIDPLYIKDLNPLFDIFLNPGITKIFHSGKEDIAILYHMMEAIPAPLFDTQVAAALTGFEEQTGYSKIVKSVTGIKLNKNQTCTDWLKRPLSNDQIKYALDDVKYLPQVYFYLKDLLKKQKKEEWAREEFIKLETEENYKEKDVRVIYSGIINNKLKAKERTILVSILEWREKKARDTNRSRKAILKDDVVMNIARQAPEGMDKLKLIPGLFEKNIREYGREIIDVVKSTKNKGQERIKLSPGIYTPPGLVYLITAYIKHYALEKNIAYGIIATKDDIEELIYKRKKKKSDCRLLQGWRKDFIGSRLLKIIDGEVSIGFNPEKGEITLYEHTKGEIDKRT